MCTGENVTVAWELKFLVISHKENFPVTVFLRSLSYQRILRKYDKVEEQLTENGSVSSHTLWSSMSDKYWRPRRFSPEWQNSKNSENLSKELVSSFMELSPKDSQERPSISQHEPATGDHSITKWNYKHVTSILLFLAQSPKTFYGVKITSTINCNQLRHTMINLLYLM